MMLQNDCPRCVRGIRLRIAEGSAIRSPLAFPDAWAESPRSEIRAETCRSIASLQSRRLMSAIRFFADRHINGDSLRRVELLAINSNKPRVKHNL